MRCHRGNAARPRRTGVWLKVRTRGRGAPAIRAAALLWVVLLSGCTSGLALRGDCRSSTDAWEEMQTKSVRLVNDERRSVWITTKVADDAVERAGGFQHLCPEHIEAGYILFVFERGQSAAFHVWNVHAPLDIAFISADGRFLDVVQMQEHSDTARRVYGVDAPYRYALEARRGFFADHALSPRRSRLDVSTVRGLAPSS